MAERRDARRRACKDFEEDLILYYYRDGTETVWGRVESHLASCVLCRRFLEELQSLLPGTAEADEPSPAFWQSYSQEMREKLAAAEERRGWRQAISLLFRPWPVPAVATALILALALTLTLTKGRWPAHETPPQERELLEMISVTDNLEFFDSLDFLDSMDLLESIDGKEMRKSETGRSTF